MRLAEFWQGRVVRPIVRLLKQGTSPIKITLSIAIGVTFGIFPVLGSTTVLCALAAVTFRLNLPAIQLVNYLVYPVQILLLIPFFRAGEMLFRAEPLPLSVEEVAGMISDDALGAIAFLWDTTWHAVVAWCLVAPLLIAALYYVLLPLIRGLHLKTRRVAKSAAERQDDRRDY